MARKIEDLVSFLSEHGLCAALTRKEVEVILDYTEEVYFDRHQIVMDVGEVGEALFFVVEGEIVLLYDNGASETDVGRRRQGELMGEMSFFDRKPRLTRMRATRDRTRLLKLSRAMYERMRVEQPFIAVNLLEYAIISLDHLIREMSKDVAVLTDYYFAPGKK
ncbi:Crp/Fnr family transcriptional regulator [Acidihalobacter ferrooxydans]|uniref:Cyclic nucleotide-binding protein n=1 Tax=Acidihalobacter ferrooxydans TaxID=1765967 RepID=A0A1P8UJP3_9GAMM|nr:cyclic nucleotide-binding protein [Acidihalobacter ferrooxydans]